VPPKAFHAFESGKNQKTTQLHKTTAMYRTRRSKIGMCGTFLIFQAAFYINAKH
jgi:hypothetical protein